MTTHAFDDALALTPAPAAEGEQVFHGRTSAAYANMVGPFGGITAAVLLRAVELHPDRVGDPLALTLNYTTAIADGEFDIAVRAIRTNRSNQHFTVELRQGDEPVTTGSAVFGVHRDSLSDDGLAMPDVAPPDPDWDAPPMPLAWLNNYEQQYREGVVPVEPIPPSESSRTTLWLRDRPARPLDYAALASACDVFFPRIFLRLGRWTPAGTVSLTTYFHAHPDELAAHGTAHLLAQAEATRFARGYFSQDARVWGADGRMFASSHQLVYFKDADVTGFPG